MPPTSSGPDADIPLQGTHRADAPDDPTTSNVRAQQPPDPTPPAERVAHEGADANANAESEDAPDDLGAYRLARDPSSGRHRVSLRPPGEQSESPGGGFREISRHSSPEDMSDALEGQLSDGPRFVVLENTETGEVNMGRGGALGGSWLAEGRYDQATVFETEEGAAAYADEQRNAD